MKIFGIGENKKEFREDLLNFSPEKVIEKHGIDLDLPRSDRSGNDNLVVSRHNKNSSSEPWLVPHGSVEERKAQAIGWMLADVIE